MVGFDGVDKRIDLLAQVIRNKGTIYDLQEIEHAYAPPFSSAKDPVNMAGFIAENILEGHVKIVHWYDIENIDPDTMVVDIRTEEEFSRVTLSTPLIFPWMSYEKGSMKFPVIRKYTCIAPWDYVVIPPPEY